MYSRVKKIKENLNNVSTNIFLKNIGIKHIYINNFLKYNKEELENENNKLKIFRLYLNYVNTHYNIYESKSLDDEIEVFRLCGFTKRAGYRYVNCIKYIYQNDSTLNWIYRIVESMLNDTSHIHLSNFLKECYKNVDAILDDHEEEEEEGEEGEEGEDEEDEDDDSDNTVMIILNR